MQMDWTLAVDIGGGTTKVAAVSATGAVRGLTVFPTASAGGDELVERVAAAVPERLPRAGVSVAGFVDEARRRMVYNPNLPWLEGYPLAESLQRRLAAGVSLDADSNRACLAEYRLGAGRGARRFLCLTLGTGAGGGMIVDGELVRLAHGGLGDIGHVIVEPGGPRCAAGCRGCLEAMMAMEPRDWPRLGRWLGIALASCAAVLFPDMIAVAGGLAEAGDKLLAPARAAVQETAGDFYRQGLTIVNAHFGWSAPLVGAGIAAHSEEEP